jgi:hypothetical protein
VRLFNRLKIQRVIIYGFHSEDWNIALGPKSKVWELLPNVGKVLVVEGSPEFLPKQKIYFKDCVIPLMENHIKATPDSSITLKPRLEILEKFANKKIFHLFLKDLNLDQYQPNIYLNQNIAKFPIVLKRTNLNACQGIKIIFTREELNDSLSQDMWRGKEFIIQEFIENTNEFVWHAVYKNGVRLWGTTIKYVKSNSLILRGPNSEINSIILESNPDATNVFDQIMSKTNYSGPCNIDFSYESSNLKIFEINPRIGGSLMNPKNKELLAQALKAIIKAA